MKSLFDSVSAQCSKLATERYSTSFSLGIRLFARRLHAPVYAIYGFVRFADEIVDSFHGYDKHGLLRDYERDAYRAIETGISLNPVLNSFQHAVTKYGIERGLVDAFFQSMRMDLSKSTYDRSAYERYIYGSAEVVGLMCLRVFCEGDHALYESLKAPARKLGSALQKVNFLRDLKADNELLGRTYFPSVDFSQFSDGDKLKIERDIQRDFTDALPGIRKLPASSRAGVYLAYYYYATLFRKIRSVPAGRLASRRIRVSNPHKIGLMVNSLIKFRLNTI